MELDKRIRNIVDILTVVNSDMGGIIGKTGYFGNSIMDFKRLDTCEHGELTGIIRNTDRCFEYENCADSGRKGYCYFIPEDWVLPEGEPKKKYRPYSLNEFLNEHEIGDKITYRHKHKEQPENFIRHKEMICGYQIMEGEANTPGEGLINLGGTWVSLQAMFDDCETPNIYLYPEVWEPFGVIEE